MCLFRSPLPAPRGERVGRGAAAEREDDGIENGDRLAEDEGGRKTEHRDAPASEEGGSTKAVVLARRFEVLATVELHGYRGRTGVDRCIGWAAIANNLVAIGRYRAE